VHTHLFDNHSWWEVVEYYERMVEEIYPKEDAFNDVSRIQVHVFRTVSCRISCSLAAKSSQLNP
jgi:hypothetical protein